MPTSPVNDEDWKVTIAAPTSYSYNVSEGLGDIGKNGS